MTAALLSISSLILILRIMRLRKDKIIIIIQHLPPSPSPKQITIASNPPLRASTSARSQSRRLAWSELLG